MIPVISYRGIPAPEWPYSVYVGRELKFCGKHVVNLPAHPLANPFKLEKKDDTPANRRRCLDQYGEWIRGLKNLDALLWDVWGDTEAGRQPLACFCGFWDGRSKNPPLCHAVIISELAWAKFGGNLLPE